ncbi:IclR helix-turn-helix domain-containing protein [Haloechinothrix alba]|uniref:IclR helix-turn-helix domain-containing protein n=1 Tax=Haloechinothrix alba TaxID=664784 RepID=A0A238ZK81_9PSEU|nr:IclR helix-turn-helix domain-containing protein [Haloechinothrix alba]
MSDREGATATGPVLARALRIFSAFDTDRRAMTLSEISRQAEIPVSTVHRLVAELTAWGALERGGDGRYRVGLRL